MSKAVDNALIPDVNPREVLAYLNELGYTHVTSGQLKDFVRDLKKLIKKEVKAAYEESPAAEKGKKAEAKIVNSVVRSIQRNICNCGSCSTDKSNKPKRNVHEELYKKPTQASQAKTAKSTEESIKIQLQQPCNIAQCACSKFKSGCPMKQSCAGSPTRPGTTSTKSSEKEHCHCCKNNPANPYHQQLYKETCGANVRPASAKTMSSAVTTLASKSSRTTTATSRTSVNSMPTKSFIRPKLNMRAPKSDPVALYQYYCETWKRVKIPGVDKHDNLRWAMRTKLNNYKEDYIF